jgi:GDP/UDP-N,N'-diacetylbacillosamine 2-epimerase (hydrolysing)
MTRKKIAVLASSRASYGYKRGVIRGIHQSDKVSLQLIVTGMHLLHEHGYSVSEIERDGFPITAKVEMAFAGDTPSAWVQSLGVEMTSLATVFASLQPDLLLVTGDRGEMLIATIAAAYMNIPVAHIQAGDLSGHIDGSARHAITKMSHLHFSSCQDSAQRVLRLGEEPWRVFDVGAPQLDTLVETPALDKAALGSHFGFDFALPVMVVIQHPVLLEVDDTRRQMVETMEAVKSLGVQTVVIFPNNDAGGRKVIEVIREYEHLPFLRTSRNLDRTILVNLLRNARLLVGNSSAGVLEGPFLKLPAVNIGSRQHGRMQSTNVLNVGHDRREIEAAARKALDDEEFRIAVENCVNPYGDGKSAPRIVKILEELNFSRERLLDKRLTY